MANILYGVNGEGSGHSTRAKEVISHLQTKGHTVHVVSFDRGLRNLSESFDVTEIYGLRLAYVNNRLRYKRTMAKNLLSAPQAAKSLKALLRQAGNWKIQLVITDFEPLTCHVGHRKHLPVISIDNQHCLTNTEAATPRGHKRDAAAVKLITRLMTPRADAYLVLSFFPAPVRKPKTSVFPPIVRSEILQKKPFDGDSVLVYVTSPSPDLAGLLKSIRCRFIAYGFGRDGEESNILFKKPSLSGFMEDLTACKAVVANSGFSLVSEALYLGKPYLAVPVKNQFEQTYNAFHLDKMGYGAYWTELNKERLESFLFNLPVFRENLAAYPRQGNSALLEKLDSLIGELVQ
ncbi:MAG TPA: glycosyltransferase family protein [Candidatus Angelobacter sp.]|jgi:uncharacterized protein (TIGR00661 family)|nr:glycosyltransferase family protein [Candidatus Angelobacter sp.]